MITLPETPLLPNGSATISIPVDQLPAIQSAIIGTSVQGMTLFLIIGLVIGIGFSYLYYRLLRNADGA